MSGSNPPQAATDRSDTAARRTARVVAAAISDPRLIRRVAVAVIAVVLFIQVFEWLFFGVRHLLFLLLLAWLFAIAMEPAVSWMARRGIKRGGGTGIVMISLFLTIVAFSAVFGAIFIEQVVSLLKALPDTLTTLVDWVNQTFNTSFDPTQLTDLLQITPERVADWASTIGLGLFGFFTSLVGVVFDLFTVLLFAFYFSAQGPQLRRTVASWLPAQSQRVIDQVWRIAIEKTGGYVVSRLVLAVLAAFSTSAFLLIIDVPYWLPLGIWTGIVSQFIPTLGTYLGGALPVLIAFSSSSLDGVLVVIFVIVYQQVENYLFSPRVSNRTMDIHPAVAFGAVIVGGALAGALGALIAIPIVASVQAIIETYGRRYELIPEMEHDDHRARPVTDNEPAAEPAAAPQSDG
ncbi:MAG: AI-2E family transporter [Actinomycetia bacterium]|nr:AI-2E family transporter [Actinomycetes bacterium]